MIFHISASFFIPIRTYEVKGGSTMNDIDIICLYQQRSEQAIAFTKEQYGRLVRHIISRILQSTQDTEECENDTYLAVWHTIPPQQPKHFKAYLAVIARNLALKRYEYLHAEKRNPEAAVSFEELEDCLSDHSDGGIRYTDAELRETINAFLSTLKAEHRKIFLLRYWQCCSVQEIMQHCGSSKSKIESILFRTRSKLRTYLEERGYME